MNPVLAMCFSPYGYGCTRYAMLNGGMFCVLMLDQKKAKKSCASTTDGADIEHSYGLN